ncbi:MAG: family 78 glycoside hydrolase catalytic domain [Microbacterium sp.]|uniref:family 78 glycoside hydrolase catalytic domain n=1 Tax=Microbacterium sp. TaxID=51671 RepID=UPI003F974AB1
MRDRARSVLRPFVSAAASLVLVGGLLAVGGSAMADTGASSLSAATLKTDSTVNPLGITTLKPSFSWQLTSTKRDVLQESYELRVAKSETALGSDDIWSTGLVNSDASVDVNYEGADLEPATRYYWQVRVTDNQGETSGWSEAAWFETALAESGAWDGAEWISAPAPAPWSDFDVSIDYTMKPGTAFGIYLRANDSLNSGYMWQLNDETPGTPKLRPHKRTDGGFAVMGEVALPASLGADVLKSLGTLRIVADGDTMTTYVNGVQVDERTDTSYSSGRFGLRTNGAEEVTLHSVQAKDGSDVFFDPDLVDGANPFTAGVSVPDSGVLFSGNIEAAVRSTSNSPMMRDEFDIAKPVESARLYASAQGVYEFSINGERVSDYELAPGFTDYNLRTQYQSYDVTEMIAPGGNAMGVLAGPGWYSGHLAWFGPGQYGTKPSVIGQLVVDYEDGSRETFATDSSWKTAPSPIVESDLLNGERYDARREQSGWDTSTFTPTGWSPVEITDTDASDTLVPQVDPPVRVTGEITPLSVSEPSPGRWVFDLGQNMVGKVRLNLAGVAGQTVTLRHAEVTHADGTIAPENLRSAKATDHYTFAEDGAIVYEPRFTFHGFRYVELSGLDKAPTVDAVTGLVMNSDGAFSSQFETSDPMVNQLQSNIVWGQRGNWLSIPTDTPARDERLGWTGDINVFASTATFNMDSQTFLTKWMRDLRDAQLQNGAYPEVAPQFCKNPAVHSSCGGGSTGWADAGITVPWTLWQSYGDTDVIRENYASMVRYIDFLEGEAPTGIRPTFGAWGDWLNLDDPTPADLLATAFYAQSVNLMSQMADVIGEDGDAQRYRDLFDSIRSAYQEKFISSDGSIAGNSQTAYVSSIAFDLVPEELLTAAGEKLVAAVAHRGGHLATGFLGTFNLLPALSAAGQDDVAYQLLLNRTYPSWGFQIDRGATTMWERWDAIREDGSFGDLGMNSFNHFAPGAVGNWMYRTIGGIQQLEPGYKKTRIAPVPGGGMQYAKTSYDSVHGTVASDWKLTDGVMALSVDVPANTTAIVEMPAQNALAVLESGSDAAGAEGVHSLDVTEGTAQIEVGSGHYEFTISAAKGNFGTLIAAIEDLQDAIDDASGTIGENVTDALTDAREALHDDAVAGLGHYDDGDLHAAATAVHAAIGTLDAADEQAGGVDEPERTALGEALGDVRVLLNALSAEVLEITAELTPPLESVLASETATIPVAVTSDGDSAVDAVAFVPGALKGWSFAPETIDLGALAAGTSIESSYTAEVPDRQKAGKVQLGGDLSYSFEGTIARIPLETSVMVSSPLEVSNFAATPAAVGPLETVQLSVEVANAADRDVYASARGSLDGSPESLGAQTVIPAGESATLTVPVVVPLGVTAGQRPASVAVVSGDVVYDTLSGDVTIELPAVSDELDHVDLGDSASETAHNLSASAQSGTNVEAGLTRRYANREDPNGFFEFDLAVTPGEPFLVRAIETFDRAQVKEYDVFVNDVRVHQRLYSHEGGLGTATYQFVVDDTTLTESGTVRVRFQNNEHGRNYDPSLADVWAMSMADDTIAPTVALEVLPQGTRGRDGWFLGPVDVSLSAKDERPGAVLIEYRLNGGDWREYSDAFLVTASTTVEYRATDAAGNASAVGAADVQIDSAAPTTSHSLSSEAVDGWLAPGTSIAITAQDADSGVDVIEYRLGGGEWATYSGSVELPLGVTTVEYRARDIAGNTGAAVPAEFSVDGTAPIVTATRSSDPAPSGWHLTAPTVELTASDAESGVGVIEYAIGNGEWTVYSGPIALTEGVSELRVRASDALGNMTDTAVETVKVDSIRPEASAVVDGRTVTLVGTDAGSGIARIEMSLDGADWSAYTAPLALDDSAHELRFRASDHAGNAGATYERSFVGGSLSQSHAKPGDAITVSGVGFAEGETVSIELRSEPVALGIAVADASGAFSASVTVPEDTAEGAHHIVLTGENPDASIALALTIDADTVILPGGLATTGVEIAQTLTLGLLLIGAGLGTWLFFVRRGRRLAFDAMHDELH